MLADSLANGTAEYFSKAQLNVIGIAMLFRRASDGPKGYAYELLTTANASAQAVFASICLLMRALLDEIIPGQRLLHDLYACHE